METETETRLEVGYRYSMERIHAIALQEDKVRRYGIDNPTVDMLRSELAESNLDNDELSKEARAPITRWDDRRMIGMVDELWESLEGDVDRDDTWGVFVDQLGMPDKRSKEYEVTVTIVVPVTASDEDDAMEKAQEEISDNTYSYLRDADYDYYEL